MGREPGERHEHFDAAGSLTGVTIVTREPEFTAADRAWALASYRAELELGPHGIPMSEATDPANQYAFEADEFPLVDFAEKTLKDAIDKRHREWPDENRNGHKWRVRRKSQD